MRCEDSVGLRAVFMRLSLSGSLEILEAREKASRVDAGRERSGGGRCGVERCGAAGADGGARSPWAWACPRCAGPGCCAARRAAVKGPASRPCRAAIPHATRSGRRCRLGHAAASPLHSQRSAARPPRQSLAFGSLGGTSAAEPPLLVNLRSAALQPLRQSSWHSGRDAAPPGGRGQPVRQSSHRAPPSCAPVELRGGLVGGSSSGGPGNWLTASAARHPTHPQPLPVREGVMPTPRPPVGGSEEVRARGSVFRATRTGARLISHARR
jgi:hypothetical protein